MPRTTNRHAKLHSTSTSEWKAKNAVGSRSLKMAPPESSSAIQRYRFHKERRVFRQSFISRRNQTDGHPACLISINLPHFSSSSFPRQFTTRFQNQLGKKNFSFFFFSICFTFSIHKSELIKRRDDHKWHKSSAAIELLLL